MEHRVSSKRRCREKYNEPSQTNRPPPEITARHSFSRQDPSPRPYPSLMHLPPEVRTMIWNYVLVLNGDQIEMCPHHRLAGGAELERFRQNRHADTAESERVRPKNFMAIIRTSRRISQETMPIFYRYNTFYFGFGIHLVHFVGNFRFRPNGPSVH